MKKYLSALTVAVLAIAPLSKLEQASPLRPAAIHACNDEAANTFSTPGRLLNSRCMERAWQSVVNALTS
jgi:hypothetical protein